MRFKHLLTSGLVLVILFIGHFAYAQGAVYPQFEYQNYIKTFSYLFTRPTIYAPIPDYSAQAASDLVKELNVQGAQGWELISYSAGAQSTTNNPDLLHLTISIPFTISMKRKTGIENVNATIDSIARQYVTAAISKIQADLIATIDTTVHSVLKPQLIQTIKDNITNDVKVNLSSAIAKMEAEIAALAAKH